MELVLPIIAIVVSLLVAIVVYIKLKSIYINLYNLSKGLDVLFANQDKILELTKLKTFVQLTNDEEVNVRQEVIKEKRRLDSKGKGPVRPSEPNSDNKES